MKKTILIVDDEELITKSTAMALDFFNYKVYYELNGQKGIDRANEIMPDAILLDIMMPGMDGWEVLKRLKDDEGTKNIPVIIFTAKEYSNAKLIARSKGAFNFIAKPFEPEELDFVLKSIFDNDGS